MDTIGGGGDGGIRLSWKSRVEIDTRAPFSSVKEAVSLFGDKALAERISCGGGGSGGGSDRDVNIEEVHAATRRIHQSSRWSLKNSSVAAELEETKRNLDKAKQESMITATRLCTLNQELEKTKRELEEVKESQKLGVQMKELELIQTITTDDDHHEHLKFVEVSDDDPMAGLAFGRRGDGTTEHKKKQAEFIWEKKQVEFTRSTETALPEIRIPRGGGGGGGSPMVLERHPSMKKKKKMPLLPLMIGSFFGKRKTKYHHDI